MGTYKIKTHIRVRYNETDQMGYVHHGNYAAFFEIGRVEFMRVVGLNYRELEIQGIMLPVIEMNSKFHAPAFYDDELTIETELVNLPEGFRINFDYKVYNQNQKLLTSGFTQLVFVDAKTRKPMRCPSSFVEKIKVFFHK